MRRYSSRCCYSTPEGFSRAGIQTGLFDLAIVQWRGKGVSRRSPSCWPTPSQSWQTQRHAAGGTTQPRRRTVPVAAGIVTRRWCRSNGTPPVISALRGGSIGCDGGYSLGRDAANSSKALRPARWADHRAPQPFEVSAGVRRWLTRQLQRSRGMASCRASKNAERRGLPGSTMSGAHSCLARTSSSACPS